MLNKYTKQLPGAANVRVYANNELGRIEMSISSIIDILKILNVPVELGAPDSAGIGFRTLRIPN